MHSIHAYILIAFFFAIFPISPFQWQENCMSGQMRNLQSQIKDVALRIFLNETFLKSVGSIYGRSFGLSFTHCQGIWVDCGERYPWPLAGAPSLFRTTSGESTWVKKKVYTRFPLAHPSPHIPPQNNPTLIYILNNKGTVGLSWTVSVSLLSKLIGKIEKLWV